MHSIFVIMNKLKREIKCYLNYESESESEKNYREKM